MNTRKDYSRKKYEIDKVQLEVPIILHYKNRDYRLIQKYPNYYLYEHNYGDGSYKECFTKYHLRCIKGYGDIEWEI